MDDGRRQHELFVRAGEGDPRARDELVVRYMPLARSLAMRYRGRCDQEDLLQVAALGLVKAIDRFDPENGNAFSSFAVPTILGEIKRYFRDRTWAVRVPRGLQERSLRVDRVVGELTDALGRPPTVAEIGTALGAGPEDVLEAMQARGAHRAMSFEAPRVGADGDGATLGDCVSVVEDGFDRAEDRAILQRLVVDLTAREREVLRMRFEKDLTQSDIGAIIGVSQMQVSRIVRAALQRLRDMAAFETQPADAVCGASTARRCTATAPTTSATSSTTPASASTSTATGSAESQRSCPTTTRWPACAGSAVPPTTRCCC